jgi:hypothetical protein
MKERTGKMYLCQNQGMPEGKFALAETDQEIETGDEVNFEDMNIVFYGLENSLAERLMSLGISRGVNLKGKNVMLITNPKDKPVF